MNYKDVSIHINSIDIVSQKQNSDNLFEELNDVLQSQIFPAENKTFHVNISATITGDIDNEIEVRNLLTEILNAKLFVTIPPKE